MFPVDRGYAWVSKDLSIGLLHLPVVREAIGLVAHLRRLVLVGAEAGVVVFQEGHRPVLPRVAVSGVADETDAVRIRTDRVSCPCCFSSY